MGTLDGIIPSIPGLEGNWAAMLYGLDSITKEQCARAIDGKNSRTWAIFSRRRAGICREWASAKSLRGSKTVAYSIQDGRSRGFALR